MKNILLILSALLFISCSNSFYKEALSYALIASSKKGHNNLVNILLKLNADINMKENEYGYTALMEPH
ncbi:ankyrin repeat domain-containing protein [Brachyspira alvinipulli]|uniref:ankyrin repeat domain-containing protein n=1 Tax=Brachyspira alvinipulli TaxID=84379 RepID=UPI003003D862